MYGAEDFAREFDPGAPALAALEDFRAMLAEANAVMNLIGPSTLPDFWSRHAQDSAQLLRLAPQARVWADVGAGAGFPGIVLAILLKSRAGARVELIDSLRKRCRFLEGVVRRLALPARVHWARAETLFLDVDVVTARACAPMDRLLGFCEPFFSRGAEGLFLKGESVQDELERARTLWRFEAETSPSLSNPRGHIVRIRRVGRVR